MIVGQLLFLTYLTPHDSYSTSFTTGVLFCFEMGSGGGSGGGDFKEQGLTGVRERGVSSFDLVEVGCVRPAHSSSTLCLFG